MDWLTLSYRPDMLTSRNHRSLMVMMDSKRERKRRKKECVIDGWR